MSDLLGSTAYMTLQRETEQSRQLPADPISPSGGKLGVPCRTSLTQLSESMTRHNYTLSISTLALPFYHSETRPTAQFFLFVRSGSLSLCLCLSLPALAEDPRPATEGG